MPCAIITVTLLLFSPDCAALLRTCGHEDGRTVATVSSFQAAKLIYTSVSFIISPLHLDRAIGCV